MKDKQIAWNASASIDSAPGEPLWQTVAGCVLVWAGFLTLCWML